jgi:Domain of Unknown Function (DUF1259)
LLAATTTAMAGDIAMQESEVQPVLKALRAHGLDAIRHHMINSRPVIIFLHYWGGRQRKWRPASKSFWMNWANGNKQ